MRLAVISFTEQGGELNRLICDGLDRLGHETEGFEKREGAPSRCKVTGSLRRWTEKMFSCCNGLIFIGACGIAVRAIAPFVKDKFTDPAVVVIDEKANFAVSLLSGHVGGANELALSVAELTGAVPVISTASDVNGKFAVDVFAKENGLAISSRNLAKLFSAAIVSGKNLPFYCRYTIEGNAPDELAIFTDKDEFLARPGIKAAVSEKKLSDDKNILYLIPKNVTVGVGCKRGAPEKAVEEKVMASLKAAGIFTESLERTATIDIKRDEAGIISLAEKFGTPLDCYTADELAELSGEFSASDFVKETTGVSCVCERAAVLAGGGRLILKKQAGGGVTAAAAAKDITLHFGKEKSL